MKKSINKRMATLLAILASAGVVNAEDGSVQVPAGADSIQVIVNELVQEGFIIPLEGQPNWYQINQYRLQAAIDKAEKGDEAISRMIEGLRSIVGNGVDISQVDKFSANAGSQDFGSN